MIKRVIPEPRSKRNVVYVESLDPRNDYAYISVNKNLILSSLEYKKLYKWTNEKNTYYFWHNPFLTHIVGLHLFKRQLSMIECIKEKMLGGKVYQFGSPKEAIRWILKQKV